MTVTFSDTVAKLVIEATYFESYRRSIESTVSVETVLIAAGSV